MSNATRELLEQHFDTAFAAPDGIKKLRELILTLAMQGKLVPQDPRDPPASELLKAIEAEKSRRWRDGEIKAPKPLPEIKPGEVPYELPRGWEWSRIADLTQVLNGRAYSKEELLSSGMPVLRVGNLFTSNHWYYSDLELEADKYCDVGDLIFSWSASFGPFVWQGPKVIYHYHIWKLALFDDTSLAKEFLYNFLLEKTEEIKAAGHGVSMVHMTKEKMEKIPVPIPPLPEQHRIVAKIDQLMARCDELERLRAEREQKRRSVHTAALKQLLDAQAADSIAAAWQFISQYFGDFYAVKENVAELRKAVLQLAVMGKLVPQNANDSPACQILKEIEAEKRRLVKEGKIRGTRSREDAKEIKPEEVPYALPQGWEWVRLGDISLSSDSGWSPQCLPEPRTGDDWGVLKVSAVSWGNFNPDENKALPPGTAPKPECEVMPGDLLLSRANTDELVARSVIVGKTPMKLMMSDKIVRFSLSESVDKLFINVANGSPSARAYYVSNASGTSSSMKNVTREVMSNLPVPLPPLSEQRRIVAKINQLMTLCDTLEQQIDAATSKQTELLDALMAPA